MAWRPEPVAGGLIAAVLPLPTSDAGGDGWQGCALSRDLRLIAGTAGAGREDWHAMVDRVIPASPIRSHAAVGERRATLAATRGCIGLDIETLERVALNACADDAWLAPAERALVAAAGDPVLALACHWVLKEAYGKALGRGLAIPLGALAFVAMGGGIVLTGDAAPVHARDWWFGLYRHRDTLFGVAHRRSGQAIPFAPVGRKPPTPSLDR